MSEFKKLKDGEVKLYHDNGNLEVRGQMLDGKPIGKWKLFYENGKIASEGQLDAYMHEFNNDTPPKKIGKWSYYYENGIKKEEGYYKTQTKNDIMPVKEGVWTYWDEEGVKIKEIIMPDYIVTYFYANGLIESTGKEAYYDKDYNRPGLYKKKGKWKIFHENGKLKEELSYVIINKTRLDEIHGLRTTYHDNGVKSSESNYFCNRIYGLELWWDENGKEKVRKKHESKLKVMARQLNIG